MRSIPLIVLTCLLLAGLQATATILALVVLAVIVVGFINRPWETCAGLAFLTFLGLLQTRPAVALGLLMILIMVPWMLKRCDGWKPQLRNRRFSDTPNRASPEQQIRVLPAPTQGGE